MVFPGAKVSPAFYNEQLYRRYQFLPAGLGTPRGDAAQDEKFFTLQPNNYQHPVVSIWNDPASGTLTSARFFRAYELLPPVGGKTEQDKSKGAKTREAGDPQVILSYADGAPAVMERTWGLGRVVLFSSTADTAWNDFPVRLSFVPLIHRTLGLIVQRQDEGLNIQVGERFVRRVAPEYLDREAAITRPGQNQAEALRDLRRVELVENWPMLQYSQTDWAGVYDATIVDPPLKLKFAAQPNASESNLDELSPAQLSTLKGVAQIIPWSPNLSLQSVVEKDRTGFEFWLPIAVIALMIAGAETYLGQMFSRAK